ncbi:hypothetical protein ACS0TY_036111 [Phlomoides rotata]
MPPASKLTGRISFFGASGGGKFDPPHLKLESDREVYRPGDLVTINIEIKNPTSECSLLIEKLRFECKGIEKLDNQWFHTPKSSSDSKQRRGEYVFMDCSNSTIVSNQILSSGATTTYVVRILLPTTIPPSYRGTTIRYLYYCRTMLSGQFLILENERFLGESIQEISELEARIPLQIWVTQKNNGLVMEESQGIVPQIPIFLDVHWKEMNADSDWAKVNEDFGGVEDGYESSRDEIMSVSSYSHLNKSFGSSLSLQSFAAKTSTRGSLYVEGRSSISSNLALPRLAVAELLHDSTSEKSPVGTSPSQPPRRSPFAEDDSKIPSGSVESGASEGIVRGRSYNIRLDDQVLLKFSPKNADSTYYFSDMIGGTLTFFHEEGPRRCLELSITLESKEIINRRFAHPSRRHSLTITKIHSDHHEVVADLVQTSFLFSIPMDGPMTFSTSYVSVQWALRFEFLTTPKNVDWKRFQHPLMIEGRDKCEWVLPIIVHAPPLNAAAQTRNEKLFSLEPIWSRS